MSNQIPLSIIGDTDITSIKDFKGVSFRGVPNTIVYDVTKGRTRKLPIKYVDNEDMKITYNRLAQRKTYAKKQAIELSGETASQYKNKLGKTIKQMTKEEKAKYNRLSKREQRLRK